MGAQLVARVLAHWTHLTERPFRILIRMAHTALDKPKDGTPAATYFAGRELLAMTLRGDGTEQSRNRAVARGVAELVELGLIERVDTGRPGHNAVYRLTLGKSSGGGRKAPEMDGRGDHPNDAQKLGGMGGHSDHPVDGHSDHPMGGHSSPKRVVAVTTPRSHEEPIEELYEEQVADVEAVSYGPRATEPIEPQNVIPLFPQQPSERPPPRIYGRAADVIAEAAANRRAAVAAHKARLAADKEIS